MTERTNVSTGSGFERAFGYNRLVKKGPFVSMAAIAAMEDGAVVAPGDPYKQADFAMATIERSLEEVDATMDDVVRTRIYVLDFADWEAIGEAHRGYFSEDNLPATTMVQVAGFPADGLVLEIEADAIVD